MKRVIKWFLLKRTIRKLTKGRHMYALLDFTKPRLIQSANEQELFNIGEKFLKGHDFVILTPEQVKKL